MLTSYPIPKLAPGERQIASGIFSAEGSMGRSILASVIDRFVTFGDTPERFTLIGAYSGSPSRNPEFLEMGTFQRGIDAMLALAHKVSEFDRITLTDRYLYTDADIDEVMANITFNNSVLDLKWGFHHGPGEMNGEKGWAVWASFERPDTHTGLMGRGEGRKLFVPNGQTDSYVFFTLLIAQDLIVRHEHMEGLHYFGHRPLYPHNSVHRLNDLSRDIKSQGVRAWVRPGD